MSTEKDMLKVGLAVGQGTGPELADVFVKVLDHLATQSGVKIKIQRSPRVYHSYHSLLSAGDTLDHIEKETMKDATHYEDFCKKQAGESVGVIFRTAITAQSLYRVRQNLEAIKIESFRNTFGDVLLIRDQAQGFYTGSNVYGASMEMVSRNCQFTKGLTGRIVAYAIARARRSWGKDTKIDSVLMVYKHHLFDGIMDVWAREWSEQHGIKVQFVQPDTMNRNLLAFGLKGHVLLIASNEYADIMEVIFLEMFSQGVQETSYSENVYLHPETFGLSEYQTVHGSADDLTGKGTVNPSGTMKAAAAILENHGGCIGMEQRMAGTIQTFLDRKICTPDQGGSMSTSLYVSTVLDALSQLGTLSNVGSKVANHLESHTQHPLSTNLRTARRTLLPFSRLKSALVIMDFQNDFAPAIQKNGSSISALAANIRRLLIAFRSQPQQIREILFIRFLGDLQHQTPTYTNRNRVLGRPDHAHCVEGTPGADFIAPVHPLPNEPVFEKKCFFDAFMVPGFETYLKERGIEHLVFAGLFADVCIDSTMRSAFQKGEISSSVVKDCTASLHLDMESWAAFATNVYGASVLTLDEVLTGAGIGERLRAKLA